MVRTRRKRRRTRTLPNPPADLGTTDPVGTSSRRNHQFLRASRLLPVRNPANSRNNSSWQRSNEDEAVRWTCDRPTAASCHHNPMPESDSHLVSCHLSIPSTPPTDDLILIALCLYLLTFFFLVTTCWSRGVGNHNLQVYDVRRLTGIF